jgi:hypothetical protein
VFSPGERRELRESLVAAARADERIRAAAVVGSAAAQRETSGLTSTSRSARSSIARSRNLQALYMVNGLRDNVVSLACLRHGLPADQGRGVDDLPPDVIETIAATLVPGLRRSELSEALAKALTALIDEAEHIDPDLASRLRQPARVLVRTSGPSGDRAEM